MKIASDEDDQREEQGQQEQESSTNLMRLNLQPCVDTSKSKTFGPWLWERYDPVEKLKVCESGKITQSLADRMGTQSIAFDGKSWADEQIAAFLSGSRDGWKHVEVEHGVTLDQLER